MPRKRDKFSETTKTNLAKRAHYICSNPDCKRTTLKASANDPEKSKYTGKAAHIHSAGKGAPRDDKTGCGD